MTASWEPDITSVLGLTVATAALVYECRACLFLAEKPYVLLCGLHANAAAIDQVAASCRATFGE